MKLKRHFNILVLCALALVAGAYVFSRAGQECFPECLVAELEQGGSYVLNEEYFKQYYEGCDNIGRIDGQFIIPKGQMDALLLEVDGDAEKLEAALGMVNLSGYDVYRVDIQSPMKFKPRLPKKSDTGANEHFIQGGKTSGGQYEVVIDPFPVEESVAYRILSAMIWVDFKCLVHRVLG